MKKILSVVPLLMLSLLTACNEHKYHHSHMMVLRGEDGGYYSKSPDGSVMTYMAQVPTQNGTEYRQYVTPLPSSVSSLSPQPRSASPVTATPQSSPAPTTVGKQGTEQETTASPSSNDQTISEPTSQALATQSLPNGFWVETDEETEAVGIQEVDGMVADDGSVPSNEEEASEAEADSESEAEESDSSASSSTEESENSESSESESSESSDSSSDSGGGDGGGGGE